ncbi:polysaccharide lyase [Arthrobacter sp. STN4]|uniref:polysaccharide lyase n=1 Tax=Arthrobacter sp. STN4 TaxID=2923276 RepID=UPI002119DF58|nr:polysaccharide lyase [Arthrobacter sp. STN4]MCQ9163351.1 polysaccharide lyase [Arthrobacter sp. STN4]
MMTAVLAMTAGLAVTAATPPPSDSPGTSPAATATAAPATTAPATTTTTAPATTAPATTAPATTATTAPATSAPATTAPATTAPATSAPATTATTAPAPKPSATTTTTTAPKATTLAATAPVCKSATAAPTDSFPGTTVVADNFESGNLNNWTVNTGGDGTAAVVSNAWVTGACSARIQSTTSSGSRATLTKAIPAGQGEVYADGYFDVQTPALAGAANSYLGFYIGSTQVASIYRNTTGGQLWLDTLNSSGTVVHVRLTSTAVTTGRWHRVQMHLLPNGITSVLGIWLDGTDIYHTSNLDGRTGAISSVTIGNPAVSQQGVLYLDNLLIKAKAPTAPVCKTATPAPTNTFPGTTVVADDFESGNLNNWTVNTSGNGIAAVVSEAWVTGACSARIQSTTSSGSMATLSKTIPAGLGEVYADGYFDVQTPAQAGSANSYLGYYIGSTLVASVYRNANDGMLWLDTLNSAGTVVHTRLTSTAVTTGRWHRVQMRLLPNATSSYVGVWLDGTDIYHTGILDGRTGAVSSVSVGNQGAGQQGVLYLDNLVIKAQAPTAPACKSPTAQPTNTFPGTTVVADNFESGNLNNWAVNTGGGGTAAVVSNAWVTGACSARIQSTTSSGSIATLTKAIPAGLGEVYADGYFDVQTPAQAGSANSYLGFYMGTTPVASVYRNANDGMLWLDTLNSAGTVVHTKITSTAVTTGRWHRIQLRLLPNGTSSYIGVWLDGTDIYHTGILNGRNGNITSVTVGNPVVSQQGVLYLDNLIIKAQAEPAPTCQPVTAAPTNTFPGTTVVADNFESGNLNNWTVNAGGDGTASVVSGGSVTGACAAYLHETTNTGSLATMTKAIPTGLGEVYADGFFNIQTPAVAGAANSYFRFNSGTTRIASLYRNANDGQLWFEALSDAGLWTRTRLTSTAITTGQWHHIQFHYLPNGAASTVEVWLDGSSLYTNTGVNGFTGATTAVSMGNQYAGFQGDLLLDNVVIKAQAPVVPNCTAAVPTNNFPGTTVVADGFECGNLGKWTVHTGGDGTATAQQSPVRTGLYSAGLVTTTNSLSLANMTHSIPAGSTDVYADGWFDISAIGPTGNDVPYFRFFTGSTRFADIYRYNSNGQLWLRVLNPTGTDTYTQLTAGSVSTNAWHRLQMHVAAHGAATTIEVWLDGAQVYSSAAVATSATSTSTVMMGSEHTPQPASINIDDTVIKAVP